MLYVRNLPFNISTEEMYNLFGKYGPIRQIRLCASHVLFFSSCQNGPRRLPPPPPPEWLVPNEQEEAPDLVAGEWRSTPRGRLTWCTRTYSTQRTPASTSPASTSRIATSSSSTTSRRSSSGRWISRRERRSSVASSTSTKSQGKRAPSSGPSLWHFAITCFKNCTNSSNCHDGNNLAQS